MKRRICKERANWQESRCDKKKSWNETHCYENFQKRVLACRDPNSAPCYTLVKRDDFDSCATLEDLKSSEQDFYNPIRVPEWTSIKIPIHAFENNIENLEDLERALKE